jgi:hypothetical protein
MRCRMEANDQRLIELEVRDAIMKQINESLTASRNEIRADVDASMGRLEAKIETLPTRSELEKYVCSETSEFLRKDDFKAMFIKTAEEVSDKRLDQWKRIVETSKGVGYFRGDLARLHCVSESFQTVKEIECHFTATCRSSRRRRRGCACFFSMNARSRCSRSA